MFAKLNVLTLTNRHTLKGYGTSAVLQLLFSEIKRFSEVWPLKRFYRSNYRLIEVVSSNCVAIIDELSESCVILYNLQKSLFRI